MERGHAAPTLFGVTVSFTIADGQLSAFLALVRRNAADSVREEEGCLRFDVSVPADKSASPMVFLYELYRDRGAFDLHLRSGHFLAFDRASSHLAVEKTINTYLVSEHAKT
jgi:(4S)-4-hydroxy-5-phosphonooxypentane-2,3-dione isomerase